MNIPVSIIERLITQHLSLQSIIAGLGNEQISNRVVPDKWSIRENIAHLARYQVIFLERLNKILDTDNPVFEAYQAEKDPEFEKWLKKDHIQLLGEINRERDLIVDQLTKLTEKELERAGVHSKFGSLTVLDWAEFFLLHEAHHMFTIFRLAHSVKHAN